jgi:hypothetical protein
MITKQQVATLQLGTILYYVRAVNADKRPVRAKINGRPQFWKRSPERFRLPMKHGIRDTFQLTNANACDWCLTESEALKIYTHQYKHPKIVKREYAAVQ